MTFRRFGWLILPVVAVVLACLAGRSLPEALGYLGGYSVLAYGVWGLYERKVRAASNAPENRGFELREWTLATNDAGITFSNGLGEFKYLWPAIVEVNESRDYLFLWYSPTRWIAVPKRAFTSEAHLAEFRAEIHALRNRVEPGASPNGGPAPVPGNSNVSGGPPSVS